MGAALQPTTYGLGAGLASLSAALAEEDLIAPVVGAPPVPPRPCLPPTSTEDTHLLEADGRDFRCQRCARLCTRSNKVRFLKTRCHGAAATSGTEAKRLAANI